MRPVTDGHDVGLLACGGFDDGFRRRVRIYRKPKCSE